jgi:LPS-assembly protein
MLAGFWRNRILKLPRLVRLSFMKLRMCVCVAAGSFLIPAVPGTAFSQGVQESITGQVRTEMPYRDGTVILTSDQQEEISGNRFRAQGHVIIAFKDIVVTGEAAEYDKETGEGSLTGHIRFSQKDLWLVCSRAEFNIHTQTGAFYDASGYVDRQFFVSGRTVLKTGPDTYKVEEGIATACRDKLPKWSFSASQTNIQIDRTARMRRAIFRVKGIPIFYSPFMVFPMEKKTRSSGLVPFQTGNSTSKGRVFSEGYFQTFGRSADLRIYGDYFSLRGLAVGGIFRIRPNPETRFSLQAYGIHDKLDQGGIQLIVDGESMLKDDWRVVARVNISSNFSFRQAFAESFKSATVSQERAIAFLTRNHDSFSTNIAFDRQEVVFPLRNLVIWKIPSLEFFSLGAPLGGSPFTFSLRASLDGISRMDSNMETQRLVQRLDVHPRITLRLPSFMGFSLMPSIGVRETYYGAQLSDTAPSGTLNQGLHRRYTDVSIDLRMPVLEKDFSYSRFGDFTHTVEPFAVYRRIRGIQALDRTIRFDEEDAIADTNEIEYGITNRVLRIRQTETGTREKYEFLSFSLIQKYYFDPAFGGAFRAGKFNAFYPLNTVTGFYQSTRLSNLAPLTSIFTLTPQKGIHSDIRFDFDTQIQRWRSGSLSTSWQQGRFFFAGTYFKARALELGVLTSNHVQGQIGYGAPDHGLSSSVAVSYNLRTSQWLNSTTSVSYYWDCCGLAAAFNQFDLGQRTESRFTFSFMLKGIGNFGHIRRPESLF